MGYLCLRKVVSPLQRRQVPVVLRAQTLSGSLCKIPAINVVGCPAEIPACFMIIVHENCFLLLGRLPHNPLTEMLLISQGSSTR